MILTAAAAPCLSAQSRLRVLQVTGAVGWRKDSIKYKKNEVFLDIVEQVNMLTSSKGNVLRCDVNGKIVMKVFLSGMPDVKLGLNDKLEVRCSAKSTLADVLLVSCMELIHARSSHPIGNKSAVEAWMAADNQTIASAK